MRRALLVLASVAAGRLLTELLARAWLGPPPPRLIDRVVLFSRPHWQVWGESLRYAPHATIRTLAVHAGSIEYDVRFRTNDLGFVDPEDYGRETPSRTARRLAFIGDSFTAGFHGGSPWVPRLRERARQREPGVQIYNFGVGATGFAQFDQSLTSLGRELDFETVVVIFISNDVRRPVWRPVEHDGRVFGCQADQTDEQCFESYRPRVLVLPDAAMAPAAVLDWVHQSGLLARPSTAWDWLLRNSRTAFLLRPRIRPGQRRGDSAPAEIRQAPHWLASALPDREFVFLQIPEKDELRRRELRVDLSDAVREAGLRYRSLLDECGFEPDDYFEFDPHLNAAGYDKLLGCVGRLLGLL